MSAPGEMHLDPALDRDDRAGAGRGQRDGSAGRAPPVHGGREAEAEVPGEEY